MLTTLLLATTFAHEGPVSIQCGITQPVDRVYGGVSYDCSESQDTGYDAGQAFAINVVTMDGEPVEKDTANAFWVMREAAAADGVQIHINSGFRTMAEQEYFYMCYTCCCCNSCNLAASPGYSNHQSGHALDLNTSSPGVYNWLAANGGSFGFTETVPSEDWHWEWWGGGPGGGICDIAAPPAGTLDAAACDGIRGWAQDPDAPESALEVHVSFGAPAGEEGAVTVAVIADEARDDLCGPLGSCNHGFTVDIPLSLQDGAAHSIHVYGIDDAGADNAELSSSPQQLQCPPPPVPAGVRRLASAAAIETWGLSTFWRMIHVDAATLEARDAWNDLGAAPLLVRTETDPEIWWVDAGWRRWVPSPEVAAAWGIDLGEAEVVGDEILAQWREGTPMRDEPTLISADGGLTVYLVDDAQQGSGPGGTGGDGTGNDGSGGDTDASDSGVTGVGTDGGASLPGADDDAGAGCGCDAGRMPAGAVAFAPLLLLGLRRRRR